MLIYYALIKQNNDYPVFFLLNSSIEFLLYTIFIIPIINIAITILANDNKYFINLSTCIIAFFLFINLLMICSNYKSLNHLSFSLIKISKIRFYFKIEPIGMFFSLIASLLWLVNSLYCIGYTKIKNNVVNITNLTAVISISFSVLCVLLIAFSANLFTTYFFYILLSLSTYLINKNNNKQKYTNISYIHLITLLVTSIIIILFPIISAYYLAGDINYQSLDILKAYFSTKTIIILLIIILIGIIKTSSLFVYKKHFNKMLDNNIIVFLYPLILAIGEIIFFSKIINYIFGIQNLIKFII